MMRIGHGFDVHAFTEGDHVMLGGVRIDHSQGLRAHSDGDVILHALCDALLGAAGLGDIGQHFPDSDARFENIDSGVLLKQVLAELQQQGLQVGNVDITLIGQQPKIAPHRERMRASIARLLDLAPARVNLKATTTEGLGFTGRGEGLACHAVALLNVTE